MVQWAQTRKAMNERVAERFKAESRCVVKTGLAPRGNTLGSLFPEILVGEDGRLR
jgi:hypothetical protein